MLTNFKDVLSNKPYCQNTKQLQWKPITKDEEQNQKAHSFGNLKNSST